MDGKGVLAIWTDVVPEREAAFEDWYNRQHLHERRGAPGFLSAARHVAISGRPRFFAWYSVESPAVLSAPGYRRLLDNPTDETRAIMPHFRGTVRAVLSVTARAGCGIGGVMATLRLAAAPGRDAALDGWIAHRLPELAAAEGIIAAELWSRAAEARPNATEMAMRGAADGAIDRALVLQAASPAAARAVLRGVLSRPNLRAAGAAAIDTGLYQLAKALA